MAVKIQTINKANIYYVELEHKKELGQNVDLSDKLIFDEKNVDGKYKAVLIQQPFMPTKYRVIYTDSKYHKLGEDIIKQTKFPRATASVFVKNDQVIVSAYSGNDHHEKYGCERKKLGIVSGQYEKCPGCHPDVHSESKAILEARNNDKLNELEGSTNYLFNHWWICEDCNNKMEEVGVKRVVLSKNWVKKFLNINF